MARARVGLSYNTIQMKDEGQMVGGRWCAWVGLVGVGLAGRGVRREFDDDYGLPFNVLPSGGIDYFHRSGPRKGQKIFVRAALNNRVQLATRRLLLIIKTSIDNKGRQMRNM